MRKFYFVLKTILVVLTLAAVSTGSRFLYADCPTGPKYDTKKQAVEESIGVISDYDTSEQIAIKHIAALVHRYPNADRYFIRYRIDWVSGDGLVMRYDRTMSLIEQGNEFGCTGGYANVSKNVIQAVASKQGNMDDFKKLGGTSWP